MEKCGFLNRKFSFPDSEAVNFRLLYILPMLWFFHAFYVVVDHDYSFINILS